MYELNESLPDSPALFNCRLDENNDIVDPHGVLAFIENGMEMVLSHPYGYWKKIEIAYLTETWLNKTVRCHREAFGKMYVILTFQHLTTGQPCVARNMDAQAGGQLKFVKRNTCV